MKILAQVLNLPVFLIMAGFVWEDIFGIGYARYEWYFYLGLTTFLYAFIYIIICNKVNNLYLTSIYILSNLAMLIAILYPSIQMSLDPSKSSPKASDIIFFMLMTGAPLINIYIGLRQSFKRSTSQLTATN